MPYDTFAFDLNELDRSRADPKVSGSIQHAEVYAQGSDKILGATIVGSGAGAVGADMRHDEQPFGSVYGQKTIFSYATAVSTSSDWVTPTIAVV